ncbi:hypothetical protein N5C46_11055 [Rossellomorea vietnamensis]|uniref:Uncharacterized protein n=1 Tax=Rossellomorea vietnamensis TaxID=218284 RepID=A0ACD4CE66_9BACI|nr:hypothetical protein [Rossellomorea vietnamensis]UXH46549.1 hypothetical protein N5C46_11055 [Rossellomorea vietnamensis]
MKQLQLLIALPSILLLSVALFFHLDFLFYLSLAGIFLAMMIKQFSMRGQMYEMRHPDGVEEDGTEIDVSGEE